MEITRIEAQLEVSLSPDNSCSVLWLVPEQDPGELAEAMIAVTRVAEMTAKGFVGLWERSRLLESKKADIARTSQLGAQYAIGETRMNADLLALALPDSDWFWSQFGKNMRPHQICAALVPPSAFAPSGWTYAGLQLVLSAAALQARPGASHEYTLRALEQAFLAETLVAGGIAATRLRAELLPPGIALTSTKELIDKVAAEFADRRAIEQLLVERSRYLSGNW
ncbi:MAG TPA: hypothetical protein VIY52_22455 [Streptosporangiaceae bacterium]